MTIKELKEVLTWCDDNDEVLIKNVYAPEERAVDGYIIREELYEIRSILDGKLVLEI